MSNMTPQLPKLNRISWRKVEASVRKLALQDGEVWVVTGAIFGSKRIGNGVSVPTLIYKAIRSQSVQQVLWVITPPALSPACQSVTFPHGIPSTHSRCSE